MSNCAKGHVKIVLFIFVMYSYQTNINIRIKTVYVFNYVLNGRNDQNSYSKNIAQASPSPTVLKSILSLRSEY